MKSSLFAEANRHRSEEDSCDAESQASQGSGTLPEAGDSRGRCQRDSELHPITDIIPFLGVFLVFYEGVPEGLFTIDHHTDGEKIA